MSQLLARVQAAALAAAAADAGLDVNDEVYIDVEPDPVPPPAPAKAKRTTKKAAAAAPVAAPVEVAEEAPAAAPVAAEAAVEAHPTEIRLRELLAELSALKEVAALGAGAGSVVIITGPVTLNFRREDGDSPAGFVKLPPLRVAKGCDAGVLTPARK
ncbi:MAG: hypothetical protein BWY99_01473 [Synergistetes bacterium ADurb.BinA166]|nr:MAG: hypothetical protein BWY99_01473 [Synergistetes bacterium ADurb.BinA166]